MKAPQYMRRGHMITNLATQVTETFKSIALAKRASHAIQMGADKGILGQGTLVVGPPLKNRKRRRK